MTATGTFSLLDLMPNGACVIDADWNIVFWNRRLEQWLDLPRDAILGTRLDERFPHLQEPRYRKRVQGVLSGGAPTVLSSQIHRAFFPCKLPDGRDRIQSTVITSIPGEEDAPGAALISIQDVSDLTHAIGSYKAARARADREAQDREEIERAYIKTAQVAAMGTLAAGIAHNFNNINSGILGHLELVLMRDQLQEKDREKIGIVLSAVRRSVTLTDHLMVFAGQRRGRQAPTDLIPMIKDMLALIRGEYEKDEINLITELAPLPLVQAAPGEIGHVFLNLMLNARHALLGVEKKEIRITTGQESDAMFVRVQDNGCGVPEELLEKVFLPFFSTKGEHAAPYSPQAKVQGSGLGLSVSNTIMQNHGGSLRLENCSEGGCTATIRLPLAGSDSAALPNPAAGPAQSPHKARILVVDDERLIRTFLQELLETEGHSVDTAGGGHEALKILSQQRYDLMLADLHMPGGGPGFFRQVQEIAPPLRPKVLIATGQVLSDDEADLANLGAVDIIRKPFLNDEIHQKVHLALDHGNE